MKSKRPRRILLAAALSIVVLLGAWWILASASPQGSGPRAAALPDSTRMGALELVKDDLDAMRGFYVDAVGLEVLAEEADGVSLGSGGAEVLSIRQADGLAADAPTEAGLYHTAILYPDEESLANVLARIAGTAPEHYSGSADHAVSLAFYFVDPDGNGLELYTDTPEEDWVWEDGLVQMGSAWLDINQFIQTHATDPMAEAPATMGHVHLRVGDLERARDFYEGQLGFAVTAESEGALFYAAGGYHHHVATNTWGSAGAGERADGLGLGHLTVHVGEQAALDGVVERLEAQGTDFSADGDVLTVDDPWGNTVRILA